MGGHSHLFCFFPEAGSLMDHVPAPSRSRWRRLQLARYLLEYRGHEFGALCFDPDGMLVDFGFDRDRLAEIVATGVPFRTSGCPVRNAMTCRPATGPMVTAPPPTSRAIRSSPTATICAVFGRQLGLPK